MRIILFFFVFSISYLNLFSQNKQNLGVTIGATQFTSESTAFETDETNGLSLGLAGNFVFSRRSEFTVELKYNRHEILFKTLTDKNTLEDITLILKQVEVPLTYTFNVLASKNFNFGLNLGASANFFHEYSADDESQTLFQLQPSGIAVENLFFDTFDEKIGFNVYLIGGLNMRILKHFMFTGRYYHGLTNPYRQAENDNPLSNVEADVSYYFAGFTYYF